MEAINEMIKQEPIKYKTVINLGFETIEEEDKVYEDQYGYPYKIIHLELRHNYSFDWDQNTRFVLLYKYEKRNEDNIILTYKIKNTEELHFLVNLLKKE